MKFLHPEFLYYMLPIVVILFGLLLTQKETTATFFSDEVLSKLRVSSNILTLKARNALFFLISVLMIVALAGPVIKEGKVEVKAKSADIMLALDISDSMLATDVYPNRLKLAKEKALELLHLAETERIGVIAFAKNSYLVSPLSFDHDAVHFLLSKLDTNSITEQGTNLMSMLQVVDRSIKNEEKKYVLLLSDGGDKKDFSKEIAYAKEHGIVVFVLGVGTKQGAPIKMDNGEFIKQNGKIIISKLNENIAKLATQTGGVYIQSVNSDKDVKTMLKEIEANVQRKERKSQQIEKYIPLFYYPLGLALLLLLIATSSMSKRVKVEVPAAFIAALFLLHSANANAGVLDFMELKDAKQAYEQKDYANSAKIFDKYAKSAKSGAAYYNAGNAFYKQGQYKKAVDNYEKAAFADKNERAKNFANMGNAYAKMGSQKDLKEAIHAYKESLKLQEDKDVRENLEAVKKALQKKKQQQQKKQQKKKNQKNDKKNDKKQQNKQQNKNDKNKKSDKNKQNKEKKNQSQKDSKKSKGKGDKSKNEKKQQKSKKPSDEELKNQEKKRSEKNKQEHKQQEKKKKDAQKKKDEKAKELKEHTKKEKQAKGAQGVNTVSKKIKMSDAEEKKWLQKLNKSQTTYLYRLNKNQNHKEDKNEKPW